MKRAQKNCFCVFFSAKQHYTFFHLSHMPFCKFQGKCILWLLTEKYQVLF